MRRELLLSLACLALLAPSSAAGGIINPTGTGICRPAVYAYVPRPFVSRWLRHCGREQNDRAASRVGGAL